MIRPYAASPRDRRATMNIAAMPPSDAFYRQVPRQAYKFGWRRFMRCYGADKMTLRASRFRPHTSAASAASASKKSGARMGASTHARDAVFRRWQAISTLHTHACRHRRRRLIVPCVYAMSPRPRMPRAAEPPCHGVRARPFPTPRCAGALMESLSSFVAIGRRSLLELQRALAARKALY